MRPLKIIFILSIIVTFHYANIIKPITFEKRIYNAHTVLLQMEGKNISDVKLTIEKKHLPFYKNPFKVDGFYALVPISYYSKIEKKKIIISYLFNQKRFFTSATIKVIEGDYKKEIIKVSKSKVDLSPKDKKRAQKEYAQAMKVYKHSSKKLHWNEDFIYPLDTKITSQFGTKRVYNNTLKSYHTGTDFKAAIGTPIMASNSGVVKLASDRFYAGNSVVIDHGQGIYTCYFHLNKIDVKLNEFVSKGQVIGLSGETGRVTGPHLHFAIRVHGVQVDPLHLISVLNMMN